MRCMVARLHQHGAQELQKSVTLFNNTWIVLKIAGPMVMNHVTAPNI